jgi:hypothetical protein
MFILENHNVLGNPLRTEIPIAIPLIQYFPSYYSTKRENLIVLLPNKPCLPLSIGVYIFLGSSLGGVAMLLNLKD